MYFDLTSKSAMLLVFFLHGLIMCVLLLVKASPQRKGSGYWLGAFVFLASLYIAPFVFGYAGWYGRQPYRNILFYLPLQQLLLLPPVLYFYIRSLLDPGFVFLRRHWLHFLPAGLYLVYALVVYLGDVVIMQEAYFYSDGRDKDLSPWYQVAGFVSFAIYLLLSLRFYARYRRVSYELTSFADEIQFKWIRHFLIAFVLLLLIRALFFGLNPEWSGFGRKFWYYLCFALLAYYISISGYINLIQSLTSLRLFQSPEARWQEGLEQPLATIAEPEEAGEADVQVVLPDLEEWKQELDMLMKEKKLYENHTLTISDTATALSLPAKKLSQVINQGFGVNFNDYVNGHRVAAVIAKLQKGEQNLQTLLGIAFDCGFNSKSTFNRAFKKHTSLAPKDYLASMQRDKEDEASGS
ncbi:MAG TPA: AraC family transcriptional regulator [Flavisolibacter sp.]|nr:AraC family transcriptional regulator [Flavisolibacter sp.]